MLVAVTKGQHVGDLFSREVQCGCFCLAEAHGDSGTLLSSSVALPFLGASESLFLAGGGERDGEEGISIS